MTSDGASTGPIDLSQPHLQRPHIRTFRSQPGQSKDGQPAVRLDDPLQLSPNHVVLGANVMPLLAQFTGQNTVEEIAAQFKITQEQLGKLIQFLDQNFLLWGPSFESKERELKAQLDESGQLPRGVAFGLGEDAEGVRAQLDAWLDQVEDPELEAVPRALVLPHLDYHRGWPLLAAGYRALQDGEPVDRVVVLGANHFGIGDGVVGTEWTWATPFGVVRRDEPLLAGLRERLGDVLFVDALDHITEPSIQVHLPWIQHCIGDVPVTGVLIPDPIEKMIEDDGNRTDGVQFAVALKEVLEDLGGRTLIISSSDLSHVGPQFGEPAIVDEERRAHVEEQDRDMLALFLAGDVSEFIEGMTWSHNPTRWCSIGSMAVVLMLYGPEAQIELIDYRQAFDESGHWLISAAACAIL